MWLPETFHFLRPWWLLGLLPLPLVLWRMWRYSGQAGAWQNVCDSHLLPHLLVHFGARIQRWPMSVLGIAWILAVLALAGPVWSKLPQPVYKPRQAQVIVLDLSRSMDAQDISPSRLAQAKFKLRDLLQRTTEGQTALIVFAGDVHTVSPLTDDSDTIAALVPTLSTDLMPLPGSETGAALRHAGDLLAQGGAQRGHVILITDSSDASAEIAARTLREQGHRLSVLGVGTVEGAPVPQAEGGYLKDRQGAIVMPRLEREALQALAVTGGGVYVPLRADAADLERLTTTSRPLPDDVQQVLEQRRDTWKEEGPWLVLALLPLAALAFRRGWLVVLVLGIAPLPQPVQAWNWQDLWQRRDQQGYRALDAEQAETAAQVFEDPAWQGVAHYRAGDYAAAEEAFSRLDNAEGHYNRGNALARQGKLEQAAAAYRQALEQAPQYRDAQENLALVEQLLQQQQQQQEQEQQQESGEQGEQDQKESKQAGQSGEEGESQQSQSEQNSSSEPQQDGDSARQEGSEQKDSHQASGSESQQPDAEQRQAESEAAEQAAQEQQSQAAETNEQEEQAAIEQQQAQAMQPNEADDAENADAQEAAQSMAQVSEGEAAEPKTEQELALEHWLRRVPDDPGGLLRNKFYLESLRRGREREQQEKTW